MWEAIKDRAGFRVKKLTRRFENSMIFSSLAEHVSQ
ncbi:hypothetical protein Htur_3976 (plasmid) [Haloterrigena turkmenica DSM 5511]|uniref:Uncharacterized protein n=1 Tax=Haloterrigena turkmenica (strain ATCC 51198 / DSM 5511 / JCM 9101 / NCIMB 13204 / VKM B-1734 / 4k) TaxID=543526 RepID=D2S0D0_HALTV|nr:hypothetical protein Htur_3976 [Haloterrigena turkmenica DSM 5511]